MVLKDVYAICTEEVYNALVECEKGTKQRTKEGRKRRLKGAKDVSSSEEEDQDSIDVELDERHVKIQDCIAVKT